MHSGEFSLFTSGPHTHDELAEHYLSKQPIPDHVKSRICHLYRFGVTKLKAIINALKNDGLYSESYTDNQIRAVIVAAKREMSQN
jgi:hypothetical protein